MHQGNQRADHHTGAGTDQSGDLIAQGFTPAGGHQHQRVVALYQGIDNGLLFTAKLVVAEDMFENGVGIGLHGREYTRGAGTMTSGQQAFDCHDGVVAFWACGWERV